MLSQDVRLSPFRQDHTDGRRCESCIDRLFTLGPEPCPQCGRVLRKINFAHQTFEDLKVEKEVSVRRRMAEL
jgi:CDK-activating kinase assembly factor MAT1